MQQTLSGSVASAKHVDLLAHSLPCPSHMQARCVDVMGLAAKCCKPQPPPQAALQAALQRAQLQPRPHLRRCGHPRPLRQVSTHNLVQVHRPLALRAVDALVPEGPQRALHPPLIALGDLGAVKAQRAHHLHRQRRQRGWVFWPQGCLCCCYTGWQARTGRGAGAKWLCVRCNAAAPAAQSGARTLRKQRVRRRCWCAFLMPMPGSELAKSQPASTHICSNRGCRLGLVVGGISCS